MLTPLFEKGAKENRRFFADPNYKTSILKMDRPSVLEAGKYKPLTVVTSLDNRKSPALTQSKFESMSASQKEKSYKDYMKLRSEGKIDAAGNILRSGQDDDAGIMPLLNDPNLQNPNMNMMNQGLGSLYGAPQVINNEYIYGLPMGFMR